MAQVSDAFQSVFASFGLDANLSKIASDFASQIVGGLFSDLQEKQDGFFGIGQTIAQGIGDGIAYLFPDSSGSSTEYERPSDGGSGGGKGLAGLFDSVQNSQDSGMAASDKGQSTDQAHEQGIQGPGAQDGSFNGASGGGSQVSAGSSTGHSLGGSASTGTASSTGGSGGTSYGGYAQAGATFTDAAMNAKKRDKANQDNRGTGAAAGSGIGAIIGGIFGGGQGSAMGASIGKGIGDYLGRFFGWGAANKETQARHSAANYLEDNFKKFGGFTVYDQQNKNPTTLTGIREGATTRFNDPHWADEFNKQSKGVKSTFSGLAEAIRQVLGITEDVGAQLAATLGENLKFNVDNARHLVQRLGLSFDDIKKKLVDVGLKGEKTWLEINTEIANVSEAFKPGLAAVGDFTTAFDHLMTSGARGFEAVQSIRDIGIEAAEGQIKTFAELRAQLLKTYDPATVDAFFQALAQRGVGSIQELIDLSDEKAGSIVGDMQALGAKFTDTGNHIGDSLSQNTSSTDENTAALRDNTRAQGGKVSEPDTSDDTGGEEQAFAKGGVVHGPTRGLMGENGPEAILPLTRRNGRLGVAMFGGIQGNGGGGGYVIHVDARNAAPGVEKSVRSALLTSERRVMDAVGRSASRRSRRTT
jgi:hypothetical protein